MPPTRSDTTKRARFAERLKALPGKPGVYIMRNGRGDVIYVGKAANIRNRVRNYFGAPHSLEPKTRSLVEQVEDFEYIVTSNAAEALHLEATLVKRHQPFFNVRLKDDKHYPYLRIDVQNEWPRVEIARRVQNDGARYFGPYASASSVRTTLSIVKKLFPWRSCTKTITGTDPRPCLDYFIHRCIAPCTAYCTKEEYDEVIRQTILFLEGKTSEVVKSLKRQMLEASEKLEYERAALIRDQLQAVERVAERQFVERIRPTDEDVFGMARDPGQACVQVFFIRGTQMVGRDFFTLDGVVDEQDADVLGAFLKQFYESAVYVPRFVVVPTQVPEASLIEEWLSERRGAKVTLVVARKGTRRRMTELAAENARESLDMLRVRWLADTDKTQTALVELADELDLPSLPRRIECYDISNIQGTSSVASMVVFIDGKPRPQEYRRFRIKSVAGANDFASMAEVLRRRFARFRRSTAQADGREVASLEEIVPHGATEEEYTLEGWSALPDLLIVDGGKGQLSAALDVMRDMGLKHVPVAGLAKQNEELFVQDHSEPIVLPRTSQGLYLVQRIRDEAHRFAVTYHRQVRTKSGMQSALDSVPGIGPKRKRALLRKFGSLKNIREAPVEEIASTVGFTAALAEKVKQYL
ncbi:MAG TPA: excinuclease ABC subunit UvrC [Dehalococcoidia bacterium]|nr:excinuclease ABC subunit UvrC [Dehalococcoidia bacterium]